MGSIPGSGRSPGGGHGDPLHYSCLENPTDRGAGWATVLGITKSLTQLKRLTRLQPHLIQLHIFSVLPSRRVPPSRPCHSFLSFQPISTLILRVTQMWPLSHLGWPAASPDSWSKIPNPESHGYCTALVDFCSLTLGQSSLCPWVTVLCSFLLQHLCSQSGMEGLPTLCLASSRSLCSHN